MSSATTGISCTQTPSSPQFSGKKPNPAKKVAQAAALTAALTAIAPVHADPEQPLNYFTRVETRKPFLKAQQHEVHKRQHDKLLERNNLEVKLACKDTVDCYEKGQQDRADAWTPVKKLLVGFYGASNVLMMYLYYLRNLRRRPEED